MKKIIVISLSALVFVTSCGSQNKPIFEAQISIISPEVHTGLKLVEIAPPKTIPDKVPTELAPDVFVGADQDSLRWNEKAKIAAFTKSSTNEVIIFTYDFNTKKLTKIDSVFPTKLNDHPNSPITGGIYVKKFSPSGIYIEYQKGGYEACTTYVANAESAVKLTWDLVGCPDIVWADDGKQVLIGTTDGLFGGGYLYKSVPGNIQKLVPAVENIMSFEKEFGFSLMSSLKDFSFGTGKMKGSIIFRIRNGDTEKVRTFHVSLEGNPYGGGEILE